MYKLSKILPQSGRQDLKLSVSGGQESLIQIPARQVFNLARSKLFFQYITGDAPFGEYNRAFMDCLPHIRQLQLYSMNGVYLCDLNFANNYTRVVWNAETDLREFLTLPIEGKNDNNEDDEKSNPIAANSGFLFNRNNVTVDNTNAQRLNVGASPSNLNYTEPQYILTSTVEGADPGDNASSMVINIELPLEYYKNTVFALDKDLYFGNTLIMRIVWEGSNRITYTNDTLANPSANPDATTYQISLNNIALYLAIQTNPSLVSSIMSQVQSGMTMVLPWVSSYMNNLSGSTQSVQIKLTKNDGRRLCKIYHSIFNNQTTSLYAYDINNLGITGVSPNGNAAKVTQYYTLLNRLRQQEFNVDTTQLDDWKFHSDYLKGSVIQTPNIYEYNWFHCDNYTGIPAIESKKLCYNEAGLDLSIDQQWEFFGSQMINSPYNHNTFAILQRVLTITELGFTVS